MALAKPAEVLQRCDLQKDRAQSVWARHMRDRRRATTRRGAGEGSIFKDPKNGRWRALVDVGADAAGRRQLKKVSGRTRAEVLLKIRGVQRGAEDGLGHCGRHLTVAVVRRSR